MVLQMYCLSSENLKEENEAHSTFDGTLIPHAPHSCLLRLLFQA
jgi:hypothetical protein